MPDLCSDWIAASNPDISHISMWGGHALNVTEAQSFNKLLLTFLDSDEEG